MVRFSHLLMNKYSSIENVCAKYVSCLGPDLNNYLGFYGIPKINLVE